MKKDTLQSMFLYELSKSELPFVFKGSTSLSKSYGLVDRFSEDIDLSMSRSVTEKEKRNAKDVILKIAVDLGMILKNPNDVLSRHDYNIYLFEYDSFYSDSKLELIVETSYYQISYPVKKNNINSYVGRFCMNNDITLPVEFSAQLFELPVQSLERTFIDKVFAVCDYKIQNMMDRDSRHLYDIAKILPHITLNSDLIELISKVRIDRSKSKNNPSANIMYDITKMLKEIISSRYYESDYKTITQKLLYENMNYDEAIDKGIKIVASNNIF